VGILAALHPTVDWHVIANDHGDSGEHDFNNWFATNATPSRSDLNIAWFYPLFRFMEAHGSQVSLGGEMGNPFFSYWGLSHLPELLRSGQWRRLARHAYALLRGGMTLRRLTNEILCPFVSLPLLQCLADRSPTEPWAHVSALNPEFAAELRLADALDHDYYRIKIGLPHKSTIDFRKAITSDEVSYETSRGVRVISGMDHRLPLSDRRVVEFFGALPVDEFLKDGRTRSLARRLLKGKAPSSIIDNEAIGLQHGDWFADLSARRTRMLDDMPRLRTSPSARRIVDLDRLQRLLVSWPVDIAMAEQRRVEYCTVLTRAIELARFLAWHENGGAAHAA
jgi:asparagine synthase (glutamine-hydrolysing)